MTHCSSDLVTSQSTLFHAFAVLDLPFRFVRFFGSGVCNRRPARHNPARQSWIKGYGGPGQFSLEGSYNAFHDVIVCKIYVFADSQRAPLLFPIDDHVPAVLTRFLTAFDCKLHEMVLIIIEVSCA